MFKLETIGSILHAKQNPRTKATASLLIGIAGISNDQTGLFTQPADVATAKKAHEVVWNKIDKPEVLDSRLYTVDAGEYVRALDLFSIEGQRVELDYRLLSSAYTSIAVNDKLVINAVDGKWVEADGTTIVATDYIVNLVVDKKTPFGDKGVLCKVVVNR